MENKPLVGWQEWVALPELNLSHIKAKIDTGAKTCALHAYFVEPYEKDGEGWVRFGIHPHQGDLETTQECHARLSDTRNVTDSGGHTEKRYVVATAIVLGGKSYDMEITLTNRDTMQFRMLLGRNLLNYNFWIDPAHSFLQGREPGDDCDDQEDRDENRDFIQE